MLFAAAAFAVLFSTDITRANLADTALGAEGKAAGETSNEISGNEVVRAPSSLPGARNGGSRKRYPGGQDEDDLQVQTTLPIPSRTFDGAAVNASVEGQSGDANQSAAGD